MPKVYLTQAAREQAAIDKLRNDIADGLAAKKNRMNMTNAQIANEFELGTKRVARLLSCDQMEMDINQFIRLLKFTGFKIVRVEEAG